MSASLLESCSGTSRTTNYWTSGAKIYPLVEGSRDRFQPVCRPESAEDPLDVGPDRVDADVELFGDLARCLAFGEQQQHFQLAPGEVRLFAGAALLGSRRHRVPGTVTPGRLVWARRRSIASSARRRRCIGVIR